eukprot:m.211716 g.211716  ORF g.211716 m.211716 type:complete len:175 (+) comp15496_c0_seq2:32-556(+)
MHRTSLPRHCNDQSRMQSTAAHRSVVEILQRCRAVQRTSNLTTTSQVQGAIAETQKVVEEAKALGKLSNAEAQTLKAQVRSRVSTSFGTRHESAALRLYESITGTKVGFLSSRYALWLTQLACADGIRSEERMTHGTRFVWTPLRNHQCRGHQSDINWMSKLLGALIQTANLSL